MTLLEACPARVRMGAVTNLEFHQHAIIPVPQELRTRRWVQVDDCPALAKKRPSRPEVVAEAAPASLETPPYAYVAPKLDVIVPRRDSPLGRATLIVDEGAALHRKEPLHVRFRRACRLDAASNRWVALPLPEEGLEVRAEARARRAASRSGPRGELQRAGRDRSLGSKPTAITAVLPSP